MLNIKQLFTDFWKDEEGQSLSEYGLILALVAVVVIATLSTLGTNLKNMFKNIAEEINIR